METFSEIVKRQTAGKTFEQMGSSDRMMVVQDIIERCCWVAMWGESKTFTVKVAGKVMIGSGVTGDEMVFIRKWIKEVK